MTLRAQRRAGVIVITRQYRTNRQSGSPPEGRAVLACWNHHLDEVMAYASTQTPHKCVSIWAKSLGPRSAAFGSGPDGSGTAARDARLYPEEIILAALALVF
jgi:hypothetical protein